MEKIFVDLKENSYYIYIGKNILTSILSFLDVDDKLMIVTDENVDHYYGDLVLRDLEGKEIYKIVMNAGEEIKNFSNTEYILKAMVEAELSRKSKVIALGGGTIGDLAGFAASIYMRGIPYIQIPTTLLAQVDSSVGGKTAINMSRGKNMVGSFYQPEVVIIDINTLKTLPKREIISGIGEIIKYAIIWDYDFLNFIEENLENILSLEEETIKFVIKRCCEIKAEIVSQDEKELGIRKILNFGHTLGHALEAETDYKKYTHGEAVLIGMYYEALLASDLGFIEDEYFEKIEDLIVELGVDRDISGFHMKSLLKTMAKDKKNRDNRISFILPKGKGYVEEVLLEKDEVYW